MPSPSVSAISGRRKARPGRVGRGPPPSRGERPSTDETRCRRRGCRRGPWREPSNGCSTGYLARNRRVTRLFGRQLLWPRTRSRKSPRGASGQRKRAPIPRTGALRVRFGGVGLPPLSGPPVVTPQRYAGGPYEDATSLGQVLESSTGSPPCLGVPRTAGPNPPGPSGAQNSDEAAAPVRGMSVSQVCHKTPPRAAPVRAACPRAAPGRPPGRGRLGGGERLARVRTNASADADREVEVHARQHPERVVVVPLDAVRAGRSLERHALGLVEDPRQADLAVVAGRPEDRASGKRDP